MPAFLGGTYIPATAAGANNHKTLAPGAPKAFVNTEHSGSGSGQGQKEQVSLSLSLNLCLNLRFKRLYLYTAIISFSLKWCILDPQISYSVV